MNNNSIDIFKKIYKIKKNNSASTITSSCSKIKRNNIHTYDKDKKDKSSNTYENSFSKLHNISNPLIYKRTKNDFSLKSVKGEYYSGLNVNKAPSLYINKLYINKAIKKNKMKKKLDYQNFYNKSILLNKNISQYFPLSSNNRNFFGTSYIYNSNKNKSCDDVPLNPINVKTINNGKKCNVIKYNDEKNITDDFPNLLNSNKNKIHESIIKDNQLTDNRDYLTNSNSVMMTLLPYIPSVSKYTNTFSDNIYYEKNLKYKIDDGTKLYNFEIQKISNNILEALEYKSKTVSEFNALEKKITKLKLFQHINAQNLQKILESEKFNIQRKYDYLLGINKIYNNVWSKYRQTINLYLHFLFDKQNEMQYNLEVIIRKKKDLEKNIEKLMIQSVKKQKELEDLVLIRNFLLQVKNKLIEQPPYYAPLLHRDSRKIELGNIILKSTVGTTNTEVIKFLNSFSVLNLVQIYEIHPSVSAIKLIRKKMNNKTILPKEFREKYIYQEHLLKDKNNYIPKKGEIIFDNEDEFISIYQNLERKNLLLLQRNNFIKTYSANIKQEYEKLFEEEINEKESQIYLDFIEKTEQLKKVKERYKIIEERYNSVTSLEFNDNNNYTKKLIQEQSKSSFVDINFFKMINYLKLLKNYKYHGVLLLEKLITIIKNFLSTGYEDYKIERCYNLIGMVNLDLILKMNKKSFNDKNKFMVYDYILKLVKLYDDICQYVKNKQKLFEKNKNYNAFMRKKKEQVQTLRKVNNAREIRQLFEDKRLRNVEKIYEKWKRPVNKILRKVDDKNSVLLIKKFRNRSVEEIEKQKKISLENEFNDLVGYD